MSTSPERLAAYDTLLDALRTLLAQGKERAAKAVDNVRLATYHEAGRLIGEHLLANESRAAYGERLFTRLAADLGVDEHLLYDGLRLHRWHPILDARPELGWRHYRALLRVPAVEDREALEREAADNAWPTRELEKQIRLRLPASPDQPSPSAPSSDLPPLGPLRGRIDAVRVVDLPGEGVCLDQGLKNYVSLTDLDLPSAQPGSVVLAARSPSGIWSLSPAESTISRRHYSYLGRVERVVDGDTLRVCFHLPLGRLRRETVRLRGIDTSEIPTSAGVRAKTFVEQTLSGIDLIGLTTTKPDAYDRYLADIFVPNDNDRGQDIIDRGLFLNQHLVDLGLARRVDY